MTRKTQRMAGRPRRTLFIDPYRRINRLDRIRDNKCVWCGEAISNLLLYNGGIAEPCGHSQGFIITVDLPPALPSHMMDTIKESMKELQRVLMGSIDKT